MIKLPKVTNAQGCVLRLSALAVSLFLFIGGNMAYGAYNYTPRYGGASYDQGFIGPVRPGSTIGGVDPMRSAYQPQGSVLGASTSATQPAAQPQSEPQQQPQGDSGPSMQDVLNQQYEAQFRQLSEEESSAEKSKQSRDEQVGNIYKQTADTLGTQYEQSRGDIEQGQAKALTDLATALKQQWRQGNVMLGTRGASDSSAAKQYAYALTKLGSQQRGDIMHENTRRYDSLKETYELNLRQAETDKNNQLLQIADWFSQAQSKIRGIRGELQARKSSDLVQMAQSAVDRVVENSLQQKSILDQWAANKAQSLPELSQMLAQNAQNLPQFQGLFGNLQYGGVGGQKMFGFGQEDDNQANIFGV